MSERGWRCIGTYFIGDGKSSKVIHYLLEKWVTSPDEKTSCLILKRADDEPYERDKSGDDMYRCRYTVVLAPVVDIPYEVRC